MLPPLNAAEFDALYQRLRRLPDWARPTGAAR